ncbi:MAG: nitrous oxide-stimulated promoter family protein [Bacillota bacterium]
MSSVSVQEKINKEKQIITLMIDLYYKGKSNSLSRDECLELKEYCCYKVDNCPFIEEKTFCSACKVHCYDEDHREKIRKVMRYSAPRMLFYHPVMMLRHTVTSIRNKS